MQFIIQTLQTCTTEKDALIKIYDINHGNQWNETVNWKTESDVCSFDKVVCDNITNKVKKLDLQKLNLAGQIPNESLSCLSSLEVLILSKQNHNIQLPDDFEQLQSLQQLIAKQAGITGILPDLCSLPNLQYLNLQDNYIEDQLPECTLQQGRDSDLEELNLNCNQMYGTVTQMKKFRSLQTLKIDGNPSIDCTSSFTSISLFCSGNTDYCHQYQIIDLPSEEEEQQEEEQEEQSECFVVSEIEKKIICLYRHSQQLFNWIIQFL